MKVAIHQPNFLPWLGYFDKLIRADKFVFLDHVVVNKVNYVNRVQLFFGKDTIGWFTVPLVRKSFQPLNEVEINYQTNWIVKHLKTLQSAYGKSIYYDDVMKVLYPIYEKQHQYLVSMNLEFIDAIVKYLGIGEVMLKCSLSSTMGIESTSNQALIDITKHVGGDTYMCGGGADTYQEDKSFEEQGIQLEYQNFTHPGYQQMHSEMNCKPGLSIIDLLFNYGPKARDIVGVANLSSQR